MASKSVLPSLAPVPVFNTSEKPTLLFRSYDLQLKRGSACDSVQRGQRPCGPIKLHSHGK